MPTIQYRINFYHTDGSVNEEQWYSDAASAWEVFRLFAEPASSEIYNRVELNEYNWETRKDTQLAALTFPGYAAESPA